MSLNTESCINQFSDKKISKTLLIVLALLTGTGPLATDMYLSAFPQMVKDLTTTSAGIQLSLTAFLVGAGVGQLIFGPLSDRFGRRIPLLIGTACYLIASIAAALAPSIYTLNVARVIQGFAGASGMVISRAIICDHARGNVAAQALNIMMIVGGIAPVIAPIAGSLLLEFIGWRGIMWTMATIVAIAFVTTIIFVYESHPHQKTGTAGIKLKVNKQNSPLKSRAYWSYTFAFVFSFASLMAYISASPFIYQSMMGLDILSYSIIFGINALLLTIVGAISIRMTRKYSIAKIAHFGLILNFLASIIMIFIVLFISSSIWLAFPITIAVGSLGLVFGNTTALALSAIPAAGLGSAVLGMLQHICAGGIAPIVGIAGENSVLPFVITMFITSTIANIAFRSASSS